MLHLCAYHTKKNAALPLPLAGVETVDPQACEVCETENRATCSRCDSEDFETRYSLGIYAGRYCDACWKESGYRDEPASGFDPSDAGERYEED